MATMTRYALAMLCLVGAAFTAAPLAAGDSEAELLATLQDDNAAFFDKTIACKRLAVSGTEAAVPVLAALLDDDKLAHYARYALEPIPSPKVDTALRGALATLKGRHLVGAINSIANRGKPEAIEALAKLLDHDDRSVATAAAHSIGRLGTPAAAEALGGRTSAEFAPALLVCGKTLVDQGHLEQAVSLLKTVFNTGGAPMHVRLAAMLQVITLPQGQGVRILSGALAASDRQQFEMALRAARLVAAKDAAKAAVNALRDAPADRTALLVMLLGDVGDPAGLPAVVAAAGAEDTATRIAALDALASLGNAEHVSLLVDAALDESQDVASRATESLAALPGKDVDASLVALLGDEERQKVAIRLIGRRRISSAVPQLIALLDGDHRLEVVAALGETVALDQLDVLGKRLGADSPELREAVRRAMHAACYRMPDRDATSAKLAAYLEGAPEETVAFVMDELRQIGGAKALATVSSAATEGDDTRKDYATRALGEWLDTSAAPVLLELARSEPGGKYGVRALRGYVRLARQFSMPEEKRVEMCRTALKTAGRDAERKLVLEVIERYPTEGMLKIAFEAARTPSLKNEAARTALVVARKIGIRGEDLRATTRQLGFQRVRLEIIKAEYGAGDKRKDVTGMLRRRARGFPIIVFPSSSYNESFGGDPAPGAVKQLKIQYRIDGTPGEVTLPENAPIVLPKPD